MYSDERLDRRCPGKASYLYLTNFGTQPVYFPRHMSVAYASKVDTTIHKSIREVMQTLKEKFDLPKTPAPHVDTTVGLVGQREFSEQKIDHHLQVINRDKNYLAQD